MSPLEADAWFTVGVSAWLVLAGGLALAALPWSDDELRAIWREPSGGYGSHPRRIPSRVRAPA